CTGDLNTDIQVFVSGTLSLGSTGNVLARPATGTISVSYSSRFGAQPPVLVPLKDVTVAGTYKNHAPVNGGEFVTVAPVEASVVKQLARGKYFEIGRGYKVTTSITLSDGVQGEFTTVSLKCRDFPSAGAR
ncbi:MAG: hypothetical protein ABL958_18595, partial [Bdellovibrionia bacterium]